MSNSRSSTQLRRVLTVGPIAVILAATMTLAACSSSSNGSGSNNGGGSNSSPFVIGAILPLSGSLAPNGHDAKIGLTAAIDKIYAAGGIMGRKVKLDIKDDTGDPTKSALAAKQLISEKRALIIPGAVSTALGATLPLTSQAKILTIAAPGSPSWNDVSKYPYHFQLIEPEAAQVQAMVPATKQVAPGVTKVGALAENDASAPPYISDIKKDFQGADFTITDFETYDPTATDVTVQLQKLKNTGVSVLIVHALGAQFLPVMKGLAQLNWTDVKVIGDESTVTGDLTPVPASVAKNFYGVAPKFLTRSGETAPESASVFTSYGGLQSSVQVAYITYNIVMVDKWAVEAAKSTDSSKVRAALEGLRNGSDGPSGLLGYTNPKFSPGDHGLSAMTYDDFWGIASVSPNIAGTKIGVPLNGS